VFNFFLLSTFGDLPQFSSQSKFFIAQRAREIVGFYPGNPGVLPGKSRGFTRDIPVFYRGFTREILREVLSFLAGAKHEHLFYNPKRFSKGSAISSNLQPGSLSCLLGLNTGPGNHGDFPGKTPGFTR